MVEFTSKLFPKMLRSIRKLRRLSQAQLAERAGFQPSAISHFESGERRPSLDNFCKLVNALRVHPAQLLGKNDTQTIYDELETDEIEFIDLVRSAVVARHRKRIADRKKREARNA